MRPGASLPCLPIPPLSLPPPPALPSVWGWRWAVGGMVGWEGGARWGWGRFPGQLVTVWDICWKGQGKVALGSSMAVRVHHRHVKSPSPPVPARPLGSSACRISGPRSQTVLSPLHPTAGLGVASKATAPRPGLRPSARVGLGMTVPSAPWAGRTIESWRVVFCHARSVK